MTGAELVKAMIDHRLLDAEIVVRSNDDIDDANIDQVFTDEDDSGDTVGVISAS